MSKRGKRTVREKCVNEIRGFILYGYADFIEFYGEVSKTIDVKCGTNIVVGTYNPLGAAYQIVCNNIADAYNKAVGTTQSKFSRSVRNKGKRKIYQRRYSKYANLAIQSIKSEGNIGGVLVNDIQQGLVSFLPKIGA